MSGSKAVWVDALHLEMYGVSVPGWYAFDENHKPVMGPFSSREECEHEIAAPEPGASQNARANAQARRADDKS
jgi:hypothetical protein